jgi:5,10-methylenetetrahydromethanopterin reductase
MRFSTMIWPHSLATIDTVVRLAQAAERLGLDTVYVGDSQMIWNDVYVTLTACALNTRRVRLGPGVTNTVTRHPAVTVNALTSLNMVSNGRAVCGIGAGDSAVRTAGLAPARLSEIKERVEFMKGLFGGAEVDALPPAEGADRNVWGQEKRVRVIGTERWGKVPIEFAVMSPKSARVAGMICDGVIVDGHMGGNAEGVRATVRAVREGAADAGRDLGGFRIIAAIEGAIDDDRTTALDQVRPTAARNIARKSWLPDCIGVEHAEVVRKVSEGYRFYQHLDRTAAHRQLVPDAVAMRCCIAGTPQDCIDKVRELEAAGITDIAMTTTAQDERSARNLFERFAREVMPRV